MVKKTHNITLGNSLWLATFLLFVLTIIGVIVTSGELRGLSIGLLVILILLYFWHFFIEIPAKMYADIKKQTEQLLELEKKQRENLEDFIFPYR